jgi:predicted component of type VI protein secretion system
MSGLRLLKIRLSLKGRPIKTYTFKQDEISVGRNPDADIFLDNPGISREHIKLEMTQRGYYAVEDLGSANGTYLNDQLVKREYLMNNDVIRVGKFSLWVSYDEDRRGSGEAGGIHASPAVFEGTTVLSAEELEDMMTASKEVESGRADPPAGQLAEVQGSAAKAPAAAGWPLSRTSVGILILLAFLLGVVAGIWGALQVLG